MASKNFKKLTKIKKNKKFKKEKNTKLTHKVGNKLTKLANLTKITKDNINNKKNLKKKDNDTYAKNRKIIADKAKLKEENTIKKIFNEKEKLEMEELNRLLSDSYARELIIDLAGENALEIVRGFHGQLCDEEISKNLKIKISDVRSTLNKLHNESLVNYTREKDGETGWYSYTWTLNRVKIKDWVSLHVQKRNAITTLENNDHYFCPNCGLESIVPFADASEHSFRCQKCNKELEFLNSGRIHELFELRNLKL